MLKVKLFTTLIPDYSPLKKKFQTRRIKKLPGSIIMIRGVPVFPRIDVGILFRGMAYSVISGRSSDFRIIHLSHLPRRNSQWQNVKSVPGYSGGSVLDSHEVPS
jgi:hypothetical protein